MPTTPAPAKGIQYADDQGCAAVGRKDTTCREEQKSATPAADDATQLQPLTIVAGLSGIEKTFTVDPDVVCTVGDLTPFLQSAPDLATLFHPDKNSPLPIRIRASRFAWLRKPAPQAKCSTANHAIASPPSACLSGKEPADVTKQHKKDVTASAVVGTSPLVTCSPSRNKHLLGESEDDSCRDAAGGREAASENEADSVVHESDDDDDVLEEIAEDPKEELRFDGTKYRYVIRTAEKVIPTDAQGFPTSSGDVADWIFDQEYKKLDWSSEDLVGAFRSKKAESDVRTVFPLHRHTLEDMQDTECLFQQYRVVAEVLRMTDEEWSRHGWRDQTAAEFKSIIAELRAKLSPAERHDQKTNTKLHKMGIVHRQYFKLRPSQYKSFRQEYAERILTRFLTYNFNERPLRAYGVGLQHADTEVEKRFVQMIVKPALRHITRWSQADLPGLLWYLRFPEELLDEESPVVQFVDLTDPLQIAPLTELFRKIGTRRGAWRAIRDTLKEELLDFFRRCEDDDFFSFPEIRIAIGSIDEESRHQFLASADHMTEVCMPITRVFTDAMTTVGFGAYAEDVLRVLRNPKKRAQQLVQRAEQLAKEFEHMFAPPQEPQPDDGDESQDDEDHDDNGGSENYEQSDQWTVCSSSSSPSSHRSNEVADPPIGELEVIELSD
ncbi:unnamed protein product [Amoebophrya sp. A120]|nr:unnamed protein product [Amoebophrya sp. A120]|eukprot:GSA120T00026052001.1